jgi:hypothetical protein
VAWAPVYSLFVLLARMAENGSLSAEPVTNRYIFEVVLASHGCMGLYAGVHADRHETRVNIG